ncbi:LapA family protein [Pantoea sp. 18069]|uniref:LapA family protein n=1 Tax=Pantoea sp. 18069 TaxID=2681415 RepID=UPI00135989E4|nr:LapA family protein [Pantoea sp. 18069]
MHFRTILLAIIVLVIAALAALNWPALSAISTVELGVTTVQASLGVIMLGLTVLLAIFFIAYVLSLQTSVLLETRRHTKELQAQRELADKAEASRFTELRAVLEAQHLQGQNAVLERLETLEARAQVRAKELENSTAAYLGQLEQQLRDRRSDDRGLVPPAREFP